MTSPPAYNGVCVVSRSKESSAATMSLLLLILVILRSEAANHGLHLALLIVAELASIPEFVDTIGHRETAAGRDFTRQPDAADRLTHDHRSVHVVRPNQPAARQEVEVHVVEGE